MNSRPFCGPNVAPTQALKAMASPIQTMLQISASLKRTAWALRWKTPRSSASIAATRAVKPAYRAGVPIDSVTGSSFSGEGVRPAREVPGAPPDGRQFRPHPLAS